MLLSSWRVAATCCPFFLFISGWRENLMRAQNLNYVVLSHVSLFFERRASLLGFHVVVATVVLKALSMNK